MHTIRRALIALLATFVFCAPALRSAANPCPPAPLPVLSGLDDDLREALDKANRRSFKIPYDDETLRIKALFSPYDPVEDVILAAMHAAKTKVRVAMFNLRSPALIAKLIELHERGVSVEVVMDKREAGRRTNAADDILEQAGIPVKRMRPYGGDMMHHKFLVIDNKRVLTGSYNWSVPASQANDENLLVMDREGVANAFLREFEELWGREDELPGNGYKYRGLRIAFSPEDNVKRYLLERIKNADTSVRVAMFAFFDDELRDALIERHQAGKKIEVVLFRTQASRSQVDEALLAARNPAGEPIKVAYADSPMGVFTMMHHKYVVIDEKHVVTGSFNWSRNATTENSEALVIMDDTPKLAARYLDSFGGLMAKSDPDFDPASYRAWTDETAGVLFGTRGPRGMLDTDRLFVVANHPQCGNGDPARALPLRTGGAMMGVWSGVAKIEANADLEYRYFVRRADGTLIWQTDPPRRLKIGPDAYDARAKDKATWPRLPGP